MTKYKVLILPEGRCISEAECSSMSFQYRTVLYKEKIDEFNQIPEDMRRHYDLILYDKAKSDLNQLQREFDTDAIFMSRKKAEAGLGNFLNYNNPKKYQPTEFDFIVKK